MPNASVGGLVSGLDTATIINQLMQLEARPQSMLQSRVSSSQREVTALQTLNSKIAGIATKAAELAKPANWSPMKATSDNDGVTVSADSTAAVASVAVSVQQVARAARAYYTTALEPTASATSSTTLTITYDDPAVAPKPVTLSDTSLQGIAAAINDPGNATGLRATLVRAGGTDTNPTYQLHVVSAKTGATTGFSIDDGTGTFLGGSTATTGLDAKITVNGALVTSSSNTIADLMPGVDITLAPDATGTATITVARDTAGLADKVKGLVDAANLALTEIDSLTASGADPKSRGMLAGDATLRTARNALLDVVTRGVDGQSLAGYGVTVDRSGRLVFDAAKFKTAYDADPSKATLMFAGTAAWTDASTGTDTGAIELTGASWRSKPGVHTIDTGAGTIDGAAASVSGSVMTGRTGTDADGLTLSYTGSVTGQLDYRRGFAAALEAVAQQISNADSGSITSTIKGRNSAIDRMEDDIADWDVRLELRRTSLERQYGALEVALGKMQNQASWLAGQISGLPSWSSGS